MDSLTLEWQLGGQASVHTVAAAGTTKIGRSHDCDVVLAHPMVSREHAKIFRQGSVFYLQNISPTNPIHLGDGVRLSEGQLASLQAGDLFRIGPVQFHVALPAQSTDQAPPRFTIVCSVCRQKVDYSSGGVCPHCNTPLSEGGGTIYGA